MTVEKDGYCDRKGHCLEVGQSITVPTKQKSKIYSLPNIGISNEDNRDTKNRVVILEEKA